MKTILALALATFVGGSAFAQSPSDPRHMFSFDADSVLQGVLSFEKSKTRGQPSDNDTTLDLNLNYAYSLPTMPQIQLAGRLDYNKGPVLGRGDTEDWGAAVGAYYNFSPTMNEADLMNSMYVSLFLGYGWANTYSGDVDDDEFFNTVLALGKRFSMSKWGMNHVSYTPEIAVVSTNSKTGGALEYRQNVQLRFLQFSVFF